MKLTVFTSEEVEEWSALYVDGKLERVGDTYLIHERVYELAGVEELDGNFLLGGKSYSDAANTIEEIKTYESAKAEKLARAAELRAEADKLTEEAKQLMREANTL